MNMQQQDAADFSRRDFIRGGSVATLLGMLGAVEIKAADGVHEVVIRIADGSIIEKNPEESMRRKMTTTTMKKNTTGNNQG